MPASIHRTYHLVFTSKQLALSLWATTLSIPVLHGSLIMDAERLHSNIWSSTPRGSHFQQKHLNNQSRPQVDPLDPNGLLMPPWMHLCSKLWQSPTMCSPYSHDHPLAGHFCQNEDPSSSLYANTIGSGLPFYVKDYCKSCTTCSHAKPVWTHILQTSQTTSDSQEAFGIPYPWIFIEEAPSIFQYTSILVIVDHLLKQSLFIPTHNTIMSPQLAQLFILTCLFPKHGVPSHVTSDCGTEFMSTSSGPLELHWTWSLTSLLDIHPKSDGQTEQTNQTLEQ